MLLDVGGVWDRKFGRWDGADPSTCIRCEAHPGQVEAVHLYRERLEARLAGHTVDWHTLLLYGGTRAGKTTLGEWLTVAELIARPRARVPLIQHVEVERYPEIEKELDEMLPPTLFEKVGASYVTVHGSQAWIMSARNPQSVKVGRMDAAFVNEAQRVKQLAWQLAVMRLSDTNGLCILACNPSNDDADGEWVDELYDAAKDGREPSVRQCHCHYSQNPHVTHEQIQSIKRTMSKRDAEIEIEGKRQQPSSAVLYAWSSENLRPMPTFGDITELAAQRWGFGRGVRDIVGQDYQLQPMIATVSRAYQNPHDERTPLWWTYALIVVEDGNEQHLSNAMYEFGLAPSATAIVGDGSGEFQDVERTKGGHSFTHMRNAGWKRIYTPVRGTTKNPDLIVRMKNANRLLENADGVRIAFIDPDVGETFLKRNGLQWTSEAQPAERLVEMLRTYKRKSAVPDRRARQAHYWDGWSYPLHRCYPPIVHVERVGYRSLRKRRRPRQMKGF